MTLRATLDRMRSTRALRRAVPALAAELDRLGEHRAAIEAEYTRYVADVSSPDMAASLETASLLRAICVATRPRKIADLGSGFSSYVVRSYAATAQPEPEVHSVDDDPAWLDRTREYLSAHSLSTDGVIGLDELDPAGAGTYDVVFYDLGRMPRRTSFAPTAFGLPKPGSGLILVDDVHKPDYAVVVKKLSEEHGATVVDLRPWTLDRFGRYGLLLTGMTPPR